MGNKIKAALLWAAVLMVSVPASAETQFIRYKNYLLPINTGPAPGCEAFAAGEDNLLYIDDIGELDDPEDPNPNLSADPNGVLDLAITLGLSSQFNLLGVGVGIPGKGIGDSLNSAQPQDVALARAIVTRTGVTSRTTGLAIPVYSGLELQNQIITYSNCASASQPLTIVLGGPWYDLAFAFAAGANPNNIKVFGIGASNVTAELHTSTAVDARNNVDAALDDSDLVEITRDDIITILTPTSNFNAVALNSFFNQNLQPVLSRVNDSHGDSIVGELYVDELEYLNRGALGGHRLRIADFIATVLAIGNLSRSQAINKDVVLPVVQSALSNLPR